MGTGTPLGSMFIELGLDTASFSSSVNGAKRAVNFFKAETRALDSALKGNGSNLTLLNAKHKTLQQTVTKQKEVLNGLKQQFDKLDPGTAKWEKAAVEIERENAKLSAMEGQLNQVTSSLQKVHAENSRWGQVSSVLTNLEGRFKSAGQVLNNMGDAMRPVSTLLTAGFTLATKKAVDFEGQMQVTKSLLADTTDSAKELNRQTSQLGDASKKWAREYGISTASINEGMQEIIKKGFDFDQTMAAMPSILDASKASGEDFNTVMNASTSILQQYNLKAEDMGRVTDSLTYVANKTAAGFADMGNAMEYVGPVANGTSMSLEQTAAAIGILSNNGIAGEKAGTALRGALTRLLKPSEQNAKAMAELGFSAEEFKSGAIDLPAILDRMKTATEGMTDAEKASLIAKAFGTEAQTGMNILLNQGSDALRQLTADTQHASGYTKELADKMKQSSKSGVERFKASLEVLQITIGERILPILTPFIEKLTDLAEKFAEADPKVQTFWMTVAGGAALAYPALNFLGSLSSGLGSLFGLLGRFAGRQAAATALAELGGAAEVAATQTGLLTGAIGLLGNPITWGVILGGGALLAIGAYMDRVNAAKQRTEEWGTKVSEVQANELSQFKEKVDETNHAIVDFASGATEDIGAVQGAFEDLVNTIKELSDKDLTKKIDMAEQLGLSDETINEIRQNALDTISNVQQMSDEVIAIYRNASEHHRQLSDEEKSIVLANQNELINTQLGLLNYSEKEKVAITKAMNGQLDELNHEQVEKALSVTKKWIEDENKSYEERRKNLQELYDDIHGEDEEAVAARQEIQEQKKKAKIASKYPRRKR